MGVSGLSEISLKILKQSQGNPVFHMCRVVPNRRMAEEIIRKLRHHGISLNPTLDGGFQITAETRFRLALLTLRGGAATVYEVSRYLDWKEFETFIARIFEENEYFVFQNYRFTVRNKRNEIDVVAIKSPLAIVVDAKHYSATGRGSIKSAVTAQKQRAKRLAQHIFENSDCLFSKEDVIEILPLIITWLEESFRIHEETAIVPIFKLNTFLVSLDLYKTQLYHVPVEFIE